MVSPAAQHYFYRDVTNSASIPQQVPRSPWLTKSFTHLSSNLGASLANKWALGASESEEQRKMGKVINFPLSLKALAMLTIAALVGVAVDLTRPKPIESALLGSAWQCKQTAFVITTCALRSARREAVPALETTSKWPFDSRQTSG